MSFFADTFQSLLKIRIERERRSSQIPDFRALLGTAAWHRLPHAVQQRFAAHARAAEATVYRGAMQVRASLLGLCLAHLCRLIGTPVAPFVHEEVPVIVRVFDNEDQSGTVWERHYEFPGRAPMVVSSVKRVEPDGTLVEALGAGLRMQLRVFESDGALHFLSTGYFFQLGRWRIPLPAWSLPGPTHVTHQDQGNGRFRFTMHTRHQRFGELYWQSGTFS